jgi:hypothetical protein
LRFFFFYVNCRDSCPLVLFSSTDAKSAVDHLSGFAVGGRFLIVLYYQPSRFQKRAEMEEKERELQELRKRVEQHKKTLGN